MNRYYYPAERPRFRFGGGLTIAVKALIIANVATYLFMLVVGTPLLRLFGLVPAMVFSKGMIWQLFTYMFLHHDPFHLGFNMLFLWWFGCDAERRWGSREFTFYYFLTGFGAALLTYIFSHDSYSVTIGASGAIFGILMAFGMLFPERIILVFFIFPMRAKHAILFFAGMELLATISYTTEGGIARFAHLGGMLTGYFYIKFHEPILFYVSSFINKRRGENTSWQDKEEKRRIFIQTQIDPILDKIARNGIHSLTRKEKKILKSLKSKKY